MGRMTEEFTNQACGIFLEELKINPLDTKSRKWPLMRARHMLTAILRLEGLTLKSIGSILKRTYPTVIHSLLIHQSLYETDKEYKNDFNRIYKQIKNNHYESI